MGIKKTNRMGRDLRDRTKVKDCCVCRTRNCWVLVAVLLAALCFPGPSPAQVFTKDNNVWVYSNLFVKRFGMPSEYASDKLIGAQGIAIRLVSLIRPRCHKTEEGEEECVPSYQWLMDVYFDLDQNIGIVGDSPRQFIPWRSALYFLGKKNPSLQQHWEDTFGLKGAKLYLSDSNGKRFPVTFDVFSYKRPIEEGLQMIQARIDADIIMASPSKERVLIFVGQDGEILHRVSVPVSYWHRVGEYQQQHSEITLKNIQGGVEKDPNIWVYTRAFAEKYNMPLSGVSKAMEGAMAMTFRKDIWGAETCGYFNDPNVCKYYYPMLWGVFLPTDAKLFYFDGSIDNLYQGYDVSDLFLHDQRQDYDFQKTYSFLVANQGLKSGAHILRYQKRKFFNLFKSKKKTRWYGGPISNHSYLTADAAGGDFVFAEFTDSMTEMGVDQYLVVNSNPGVVQLRDLYDAPYHKARIPNDYLLEVQKYVKEFEDKNGSIVKLVEKHFKDALQGEK